MPHRTTFPCSYGHENTPTESYSPLLPMVVDSAFIFCWFSVGALPMLLPKIDLLLSVLIPSPPRPPPEWDEVG
jgi:hypothetical protein